MDQDANEGKTFLRRANQLFRPTTHPAAQIEAKRRAVMPPMTSLRRRLPVAFRRPTRPEHFRRRGKPAGKQAGARVGRKAGTCVPRLM